MKFVKTTLTCLGCRTPLKEGQTTVCDHCKEKEVSGPACGWRGLVALRAWKRASRARG